MASNDKFETGFANRQKVLGAQHVENAWTKANEFNRPVQKLATEYCWGEIWGDETLPFKTRSIINIAMLATMGQHHELMLHVKAALGNGVSVEEIRATLLQVTVYAGLPVGLAAFRSASEVIDEHTQNK